MRLTILALSLLCSALRADEGMWTFDHPPLRQMKAKYGFAPDAAWLKRLQLATVRFPGGTGAFVSPDGLVITNHHVGQGPIQQLSTPARDLVRDGFAAPSREQELKVPGLELMLLVSTEDVTARVRKAVRPGTPDREALKARQAELSAIRTEQEKATGLTCEPVTLYQGGEYWVYRYRKFTDVRLAAAPEMQVANFGRDADNYAYPRWDLDFALFRVYEEGRPYRSEAFLPFAARGLAIGDLTLISGHPGTTFRQQTAAQMRFARDLGIPFRLASLERQKKAMVAFSATSAEARRLGATAIYGIDNGAKRLSAQLLGISRPGALGKVEAEEAALQAAVRKDPALEPRCSAAWTRVEQAVARQAALLREHTFQAPRDATLLAHALTLVRIHGEEAKSSGERLDEFMDGTLKATRGRLTNPRPIEKPLETVRLAVNLREALDLLGAGHPFVQALVGSRSPEEVAAAAVAGTRLQDPAARKALLEGGPAAVAADPDPMLALARLLDPFNRRVRRDWEEQVQGPLNEHGGRIAEARFAVHGKEAYPDATFTLRLSYGPVVTYDNGTGTKAQPFTTFLGLYDRHHGWGGNAVAAEDGSWTLPARWLERMKGLDLTVPYNFIYACDTVGGNSGSPVVNIQGEFVGINFDSVYEGQGGYYVYDARTKRAVAVDARAILQSLERVMDAPHLAKELRGR